LSDPDQRLRYDRTIELHERFIERRGHGEARASNTTQRNTEQQAMRPFAFRPLA